MFLNSFTGNYLLLQEFIFCQQNHFLHQEIVPNDKNLISVKGNNYLLQIKHYYGNFSILKIRYWFQHVITILSHYLGKTF